MTTRNNSIAATENFIKEVCGEENLRIDQDLGHGYVRLKISEAEKRQAAQDIRSSEDIVIELLRNSRDADARNIYVALHREGALRRIVIIDDGSGIPAEMHARIFEPRVTSKLNSAHMDRWGMHGRGMALYSVRANSEVAEVVNSSPEKGAAIAVVTDLNKLPEKTDQSTFPHFEMADGKVLMRGPKNIIRTVAEFALECRGALNVYCGSTTEIAAVLYWSGLAKTSPAIRAFRAEAADCNLTQALAFAADPADMVELAARVGLDISERSARRIMDDKISVLPPVAELIKGEVQGGKAENPPAAASPKRAKKSAPVKFAPADLDEFSREIHRAFRDLSERYFLDGEVSPEMHAAGDKLQITIPLRRQ